MKKYLMMLFALLMMGSASVVMTSCGVSNEEAPAQPQQQQNGGFDFDPDFW